MLVQEKVSSVNASLTAEHVCVKTTVNCTLSIKIKASPELSTTMTQGNCRLQAMIPKLRHFTGHLAHPKEGLWRRVCSTVEDQRQIAASLGHDGGGVLGVLKDLKLLQFFFTALAAVFRFLRHPSGKALGAWGMQQTRLADDRKRYSHQLKLGF